MDAPATTRGGPGPARAPHWTVHSDGSAMPNPGRLGLGAVLTAPDGSCHLLSQATHTTGCNNEAELRALTMGLQAVRARGATAVVAHTDNSILVEQLCPSGDPPRPIARLAPLFDEARALLRTFDEASVRWIPRHRNAQADALARAALGVAPKAAATPAKRKRR